MKKQIKEIPKSLVSMGFFGIRYRALGAASVVKLKLSSTELFESMSCLLPRLEFSSVRHCFSSLVIWDMLGLLSEEGFTLDIAISRTFQTEFGSWFRLSLGSTTFSISPLESMYPTMRLYVVFLVFVESQADLW